jgi:hypothetical protein
MTGSLAPAPLAGIFYIDRRADGPTMPRFERAGGGAPLLASTFNLFMRGEERMRGLLDVCELAAHQRIERVAAAPSVDPSQLAEAVLDRLGAGT